MNERILRLPAVKEATGLSRSSIYQMIAKGSFPRPCQIGVRAVGWKMSEIANWIEQRAQVRSTAAK